MPYLHNIYTISTRYLIYSADLLYGLHGAGHDAAVGGAARAAGGGAGLRPGPARHRGHRRQEPQHPHHPGG